MEDKKVSFMEALIAKKMGFEIYGLTEKGEVTEWNPSYQTIVSWYAIENADWYIKAKE